MLPEIVRAAAEPLGKIDSLTVLSSEGATDLVKTTTRTLAEASTTVKGLTGIDIPDLISSALGQTAVQAHPAAAAKVVSKAKDDADKGPGGPGGGSGGSGGPGGSPAGGAPSGGPAGPAAASGSGPAASASGPAPSASASPAPAVAAAPAPAEATPAERFDAAAKAMEDSRSKAKATEAKTRATGGLTSAMPPMPPVSDLAPGDARRLVSVAGDAIGITEQSTLSESANRLAEELIRIPGIERFGGTRLRDLERSGPRTLRSLWGAARDELAGRYGDITIGTLLDAYVKDRNDQPPAPPR